MRGLILVFFLTAIPALAHDKARPDLDPWFNDLHSAAKEACCSSSEAIVVADADWKSDNGQYEVFIEGEWRKVDKTAIVTAPNLSGRTYVWPVFYHNGGKLDRVTIRCFMPGPMS